MIFTAVIAGLIAGGAYLAGTPLTTCLFLGGLSFMTFAYNLSRAEIEELKLILNQEAPGWQERNALWTSTWDWNRQAKRLLRRRRK